MLTGHDVRTAYEMGWDTLTNGKLLDAVQAAGFDIFVTSDQRLKSQQNLAGRKIAVVALGSNHWDTIKADPARVIAACAGAGEGAYIVVPYPKPPRRRRTPPTSVES